MSNADYDRPDARVVRAETEVPGTPEEVWRAIATGPGITAWGARSEVEERAGGRFASWFGPEPATGTVTVWEPPHRFGYELPGGLPGMAEGTPPWAAEFLVEARDGGTCLVRVVSGFFRDGEGWEEQLGGTERGWRNGLRTLGLYLAHFAWQPAANLAAMTQLDADPDVVSAAVVRALGLTGVGVGEKFETPVGVPTLAGVVEQANADGLLLRTTAPGPGLFELAVHPIGGALVGLFGFVYGDDRDAVAAQAGEQWSGWLRERLPALVGTG